MNRPIRMPFDAPERGALIEVAKGVFWARMPLPIALDHVNVYILDDGDGWSIIDTGVDSKLARRIWTELINGPLNSKPIKRVIVTHHHLDHIGLAGWFVREFDAELLTTRASYLTGRMLHLDVQDAPTPEMMAFWRSCGMARDVFEKRAAERPFNTSDLVAQIPLGYTRLAEGDVIDMGGRRWDIRLGNGHAPEHATFWAQDGDIVIGGDQLLGSISPNLGVTATEPFADPVKEWIETCERFVPHANDEQLVLTGHKMPYRGLPARLRQLLDNHHGALQRLLAHLSTPRTACDCFVPLFKREITGGEYGLAMVEAMAHCVHLFHLGLVTRETTVDGAIMWQVRGT